MLYKNGLKSLAISPDLAFWLRMILVLSIVDNTLPRPNLFSLAFACNITCALAIISNGLFQFIACVLSTISNEVFIIYCLLIACFISAALGFFFTRCCIRMD